MDISLKSIRAGYPSSPWELAVEDLSLGAESVCGIVGPNGSGKSTLIKLAAGLLAPRAGEVRLTGRPMRGMARKEIARQVGYLPQEAAVMFDYRVEEVVAMGRHPYGGVFDLNNAADALAVDSALEAVALSALRHRPLSELSGGERRRAWVAAALAQEPGLLLLDEPTQALDVHQSALLMAVLTKKASQNMSVVAILHDVNLAALFCDRIILLRDGNIAADGSPGEILTQKHLVEAYGCQIDVFQHPNRNLNVILPKK